MRPFLGYILFLAAFASAGAQTSTWWYPLGPLEATRYQPAPTMAADTPVVRWRTTALYGSPLVLVGSIRPDSAGAQQIVGQIGNEVRVLRSAGWLDIVRSNFLLPPDAQVRLTGLFASTAPSAVPAGAANTVGLGVTRIQPNPSVNLYGLLLDTTLTPRRQLRIASLNETSPRNLTASIHPVAVFTPPGQTGPTAVAIVSQDAYDPATRTDTMVNGVRRYQIDPARTEALPSWSFAIAPRAYPQHPALAIDADIPNNLLVAPATSAYPFTPAVEVTQVLPNSGVAPSTSGRGVSFLLNSYSPTLNDVYVELVDVPAVGTASAEVHEYMVTLSRNRTSPPQRYRLVSENHDRERPGTATLYLRFYNRGQPGDQQQGRYVDPTMVDLGWSIVQADLDGTDSSVPRPSWIRPSAGLEIVGARRRLDDVVLDTNRLYVFNFEGDVFARWADQAFQGELLCAGDLVLDEWEKDEIVVADDGVVSILRLRQFNDPLLATDVPNLFDTVATYRLDAPVSSAAIADVDGDGANDLVVVTASSTYLIGRPHPMPLGTLAASRPVLCVGDTISFAWRRAVAGGENGLVAEVVRIDSAATYPIDGPLDGTVERYTLSAGDLPPGRYRLRLADADVASVSASSAEFEIRTVSIESFTVPTAAAGEFVTIATDARCAERLVLEYSFDLLTWARVGSEVPVNAGRAEVRLPMPCPREGHCGATTQQRISFRFTTPDGTIASPVASAPVTIEERVVQAEEAAPGVPRSRRLRWSAAEFGCDTVRITVSTDNGATWVDAGTAAAEEGTFEIEVEGELEQEALARVCCQTGCGTGLARFVVSEIGEADFVAPNPFDPSDAGESDATIIYRLRESGTVSITIYDVSRTVVRRVVEAEPLRAGLHRATWDGRNESGDIVADGTYICIVASGTGERIVLPLSVAKR